MTRLLNDHHLAQILARPGYSVREQTAHEHVNTSTPDAPLLHPPGKARPSGSSAAQSGTTTSRSADASKDDRPGRAAGNAGAALTLPYERDVLAACLDYLAIHPRVAWRERMNTGGVERPNADGTKRYIRFAFKGCSDIIGQLKDGRFLAVECKRPGESPSSDQWAFLCNVMRNGGVAFVATSVDDCQYSLASATA